MKRVLANGFEIPVLGYGTFPLKEKLEESVPCAVGAGYRMVDASDNYGNEIFLGKALEKVGEARESIVVITKFSNPMKTRALDSCFEASRKKLGGKIDVYLLHWPYPFLWREQWRRMEELYLSGRCRAIGVCNFDRRRLAKLLACCRVKPQINQFERHPLFQQRETAEFCRENGIQVMSYSPLARMDARLMRSEVLADLASKYGKTVGQIVLRWNIEHGDIPIPASGSSRHIEENFDVFDFELTPDEMRAVDALDAGCRIRFDPATRFTVSQKLRFLSCRLKGWIRNG